MSIRRQNPTPPYSNKQEAKAQQVLILQDLGFGANTQDHHAHRDISDFLFDDEQE